MSALPVINLFQFSSIGALHFFAEFNGMRKPQDFIVYPVKAGDQKIVIQSVNRIGTINLTTGICFLSAPQKNGAYFSHLSGAKENSIVGAESLAKLKALIEQRSSGSRPISLSSMMN